MHPTNCKSLHHPLCLSITIALIHFFILCSSLDDPRHENCMQPFKCGDPSTLLELKYPFWGINRGRSCGQPGYELKCLNNVPIIEINSTRGSTYNFQVIGTNPQSNTFTVVVPGFWHNLCPQVLSINKTTYASYYTFEPGGKFNWTSSSSVQFLTILYGCPPQLRSKLSWSGEYSCSINNTSVDVHFATHTVDVSLASECLAVVVLPMLQETARALDDNSLTLPRALDEGFELSWDTTDKDACQACMTSGGQCGHYTDNGFYCYCPDAIYPVECPQRPHSSKRGHIRKKMILVTVAAAGIVIMGFLVFFSKHILQKFKPNPLDRDVEESLNSYASLVPRRYTYRNVKKMTNSFKQKLGEGGYGEVFKGSLHDGRAVAVKVWKQSKGDGKDFVNEVMSISRTSHVNVVPLLGFCFEGHKRALIYEFMPCGSLEKFISGKYFNENNNISLSVQKLLEIALGIAKGLEYLHQGCNTRIVHFDIKPHNILLDAELIPKISDFGLAKPYKKKESIISMSEARGTIGYIAPEVFFRSYGGVSHKSDVYSYGMMVLEMVGCTNREHENAENSSELYFPQLIYKRLEQLSALDCGRILSNANGSKRKMILVGLWCIQTNPLNRPPMSRVVEMLEGEVGMLEVPPMPSLFSPQRQQQPTGYGSDSFLPSTTGTLEFC